MTTKRSSELINFQHSLQNDEEEKKNFVSATVTSDDDDGDSSSDYDDREAIKIVPPKKPKKNSHIETLLMEQLVSQQRAYLRAQKTIYKLRTEMDTEEVKTRYIKLDLNNAQVRIDELSKYVNRFYYSCGIIGVVFLFLFIRLVLSIV